MKWNSGATQVWKALAPDRAWRLVEGKAKPLPMSLPHVDMGRLLTEEKAK